MKKFLYKIICLALALALCISPVFGCGGEEDVFKSSYHELNVIEDNYRTWYEIFVGSFYDSDGQDGGSRKGDLKGVIKKLDYLNDGDDDTMTDLGINGIWLMPINPSDSYHKYDVKDYKAIDPEYGTMEDFDKLLEECEKRGIKVIIDLVLNHTAYAHPWFQNAVKALNGQSEYEKYKTYYNFSRSSAPGWSNRGMPSGWYYECQFWDGMPDLNMDNQEVRNEIKDVASFWLNKGVGGFRLDAAMWVYGEESKNLEFWSWFKNYCKSVKSDSYLLAEVWDSKEKITNYYTTGLDSMFNYPYATADGVVGKVTSGRAGDGKAYAEYLKTWNDQIKAAAPQGFEAIDVPFLSGHDNDRSSSYFGNDKKRIMQAANLYLLAPGAPMIYYGEEIGATGTKGNPAKDENVRLPMQWAAKDPGITYPPSGSDEIEQLFPPVDKQQGDRFSILNHYKRLIRIRNENPEIARGQIEVIDAGNNDIAAYKCTYNNSSVIVVINLTKMFAVEEVSYKLPEGYSLRNFVSVDGKVPSVKNGTLKLPGYSAAVLK